MRKISCPVATQTPMGLEDDDPATSEGLFVFTSDSPTVDVGVLYSVTGEVSEFIPGGDDSGGLSVTQISADDVTSCNETAEVRVSVIGSKGL